MRPALALATSTTLMRSWKFKSYVAIIPELPRFPQARCQIASVEDNCRVDDFLCSLLGQG